MTHDTPRLIIQEARVKLSTEAAAIIPQPTSPSVQSSVFERVIISQKNPPHSLIYGFLWNIKSLL